MQIVPAGAGIRDVTTFSFTAAGSGTSSLSWDLGDGTRKEGASITHTYDRNGTFDVVLLANGSQAAATQLTVGDLTGTWVFHTSPATGIVMRLVVVQDRENLSGQWFVEHLPGNPYGGPASNNVSSLSGTVTSPRTVTMTQHGECKRTTHAGTVNAALTIMTTPGETFGNPTCGPVTGGMVLHRE
jgi:PKD repeat protein